MPQELLTKTDIAAPRDIVWAALVDVGKWSTWNPTLFDVEGPLEPGRVVRMKLRSGSFTIPMRQQIIDVSPPAQLLWRSLFGPPWLLRVTRGFQIHQIDGARSRLVQFEDGTGLLAGATFGLMSEGFRKGHEDLASGLRAAVERSPAGT